MIRRPPRSTRTDTLFPYTTLFRSDYEAIRSVVLQGQAVSTGSSPLMPVLSEYYDDSITEYEYDPELSRELMEEAGYTADGSGMFPVSFRLLYSLQDPVTSQWAQLVKDGAAEAGIRSEEHTSELQSLMRISYAVFCLKKKKQ